MDKRDLDAGVGNVPSQTVDTNSATIGGGRHYAQGTSHRSYPLDGELMPSPIDHEPVRSADMSRQPPSSISIHAPTISGHVVRTG